MAEVEVRQLLRSRGAKGERPSPPRCREVQKFSVIPMEALVDFCVLSTGAVAQWLGQLVLVLGFGSVIQRQVHVE